ncbi:hypothetical protein VTK56DRAFT_3515 [Thermocarpiscus australiensis]
MMPAPNSPTSSFSLFPSLPNELRFQIWEWACCTERVIPILPGKGHLSPVTHPALAVPPVLHVCTESRSVGLSHYNRSFHPQVYVNPNYDLLLMHVCFPHQKIDGRLYRDGFDWSAAPKTLAVFLDDISFSDADDAVESWMWERPEFADMYCRTWRGPTPQRERLVPFSQDFLWSLVSKPFSAAKFREMTLLVLPPLTARPNPVAQRIELVEGSSGAQELVRAGRFFTDELALRAREHARRWPMDATANWSERAVPRVRVRFATCTPWDSDGGDASTGAGEDLKFEDGVDAKLVHKTRMEAQEMKQPFCADQGLGPHVIFRKHPWRCGAGAQRNPYCYRATMEMLWPETVTQEDRKSFFEFEPYPIKTYKGNGVWWQQRPHR